MKGFLSFLLISYCLVAVSAQAGDETVDELLIEVLEQPSSCPQKSQKGQTLSILYKGSLANGKVFDSSLDRRRPFTVQIGVGRVIKGWDQGLLDMCVGEKRRLTIPPHLGYGDRGAGGVIPPGATLIFETELLQIQN